MNESRINDILAHLDPSIKKELLNSLVNMLLEDLSETEKKELLHKVASGDKRNRQVIEMVEH
ncbi:MAG: hypothetical protein GXO97_05030 [Nitrospirae bacterium]|nr:hypothetical protein [Nitrospirota bacterium]